MFKITPAAADQIQIAASQGGTEGMVLRLAASKVQDGSIDYKMGFDEGTDDDIQMKVEGIEVVIAPEFIPLLDTATLDFVELEPGDKQFIFLNPQDASYQAPESA